MVLQVATAAVPQASVPMMSQSATVPQVSAAPGSDFDSMMPMLQLMMIAHLNRKTHTHLLCAIDGARTKSDSSKIHEIHRKSIKLGNNGPISSSCTFRKFLKIYTDVLHDMVVDYHV